MMRGTIDFNRKNDTKCGRSSSYNRCVRESQNAGESRSMRESWHSWFCAFPGHDFEYIKIIDKLTHGVSGNKYLTYTTCKTLNELMAL